MLFNIKPPTEAEEVVKPIADLDNIYPETLELEFIKSYLRVDHDYDDIEITILYRSVIDYVRKHIKQPDDMPLMDYSLIPPILAMLSYCYDNRTPITKVTETQSQLFINMLDIHRNEIL